MEEWKQYSLTTNSTSLSISSNISNSELNFMAQCKDGGQARVKPDGSLEGNFADVENTCGYDFIVNLARKYQELEADLARLVSDQTIITRVLQTAIPKHKKPIPALFSAIGQINKNGINAPVMNIVENSELG